MARLGHSTPQAAMRYQHAAAGRDREIDADVVQTGRRMTELPVVVIFCEGSPDEPHPRFVIAVYRRAHATPTPTPALWTPRRSFGGRQLRPAEQSAPQPDGSMLLRFRLRCRCGRNEKHKAERRFMVSMFAVFDSLWYSGRDTIEARELIGACRS